jgi:LysM repeat protein
MRRAGLILLVGILVLTVAPLASAQSGSTTHTVQPGENLYRIALRYGVSYQALAAANGITNPSLIYVGQQLVIPGASGGTSGSTTGGTGQTSSGGQVVHVVQAGENLYRIASRYGTTYQSVAAANGITNPSRIYVGQRLVIPGASSGTSGSSTGGTGQTSSGGQVVHVVQAGENLYRIALRYGTTYQSVAAANGISNPAQIYVGQRLVIPGASGGTSGGTSGGGPAPTTFAYGVQVHMIDGDYDRILDATQDIGFTWIKQQITWKSLESERGNINWAALDEVVNRANARGLYVLLSVAKAPKWARTTTAEDGPPADFQEYARFMGALAQRYKGKVHAYEIWNEQNLRREWNGATLSASSYISLLRAAYQAIKAADPNALVISGAPAPTGVNDGVTAIDDRVYLAQMYAAGLASVSDGIGAHPNGWANPPDSLCCNATDGVPTHDDHRSFFFRQTVEDYRAIMVRYGDSGTRLWPTEFGWGSNENISSSIQPGFDFVGYTTEAEQAAYLRRGLEMAKGYGYVGPTFVWNLNFCPVAGADAEQCYWGLVRPDWSHRPAYDTIKALIP